MITFDRRQFLAGSSLAVLGLSGCLSAGGSGDQFRRLVGVELANSDPDRAHTFEVLVVRDRTETVLWDTVTLEPDVYTRLPATWDERESFACTVRVDGGPPVTRAFPGDLSTERPCHLFTAEFRAESGVDAYWTELGECAAKPTGTGSGN